MRRALLVLLGFTAGGFGSASAQPPSDEQARASAAAARAPAPSAAPVTDVERDAREFDERSSWFSIPAGNATTGARTIAAGERVAGPVAIAGGDLDVFGTIDGDAVAYDGDIVVHPGGAISGDAVSVLGRVRMLGGTVGGEARSVRGSLDAPPAIISASPFARMRAQLGLVGGWFVVLAMMGVGVLLFASGPLDGVVERLEQGFGASLLAGIVGQIALAPALLLLVVALAITVIGLLLLPFAIPAFVVVAAGLMTLGFLAVARIVGGALGARAARARLSSRGAALRALLVGIVAFTLLWVAAALLVPLPTAATIVRGAAFAVTWVAVTAGFGAALLSRAGTRRSSDPTVSAELSAEALSWQTPTPIGGVAAARRQSSPAR